MDLILPPGSALHQVFCPRCLVEFDLETRRPCQLRDGTGPIYCVVCVSEFENGHEYVPNQQMIDKLPDYIFLTRELETLYQEFEESKRVNLEVNERFASIGGANLMRLPFLMDNETTRPEPDPTQEGPQQLIELLRAIENLRFDVDLSILLCDNLAYETNAVLEAYEEVVRESSSNVPFDASRSVTIHGIPHDYPIFDWFEEILEEMVIENEVVERKKVEFPMLRVQFINEEVRNQFAGCFDEKIVEMYEEGEVRPTVSLEQ